jgi:hypothetical protein
MARQVAEFALAQGRHKAGLQQAMFQQVCDPFRIVHVRLAPWHGLDMGGIDQEHLEVTLQQVEHRFPVLPSTLHRHMCDAVGQQPVGPREQIDRHRAERAGLLVPARLRARHDDRGDHRLLMHIETRAMGMNDLHGPLPRKDAGRHGYLNDQKLICVLPVQASNN